MKLRLVTTLLIAVLLCFTTLEYENGHISIVKILERESYDWRLSRNISETKISKDIIIVDIDRETLLRIGGSDDLKFREYVALLNDRLFDYYKVKVVGYVAPFTPLKNLYIETVDQLNKQFLEDGIPDYQSEKYLFSQLEQFRDNSDYDEIFTKSLKNRLIVLGFSFDDTAGRGGGSLPYSVAFTDTKHDNTTVSDKTARKITKKWNFNRGYTGNVNNFIKSTQYLSGHNNLSSDEDGSIRRTPVFLRHSGQYYMSLPLAMLYASKSNRNIQYAAQNKISVVAKIENRTIKGVTIGRHHIALNADGSSYIKFRGVGGRSVDFDASKEAVFHYVPFTDVLDKITKKEDLQNKFIIVSSSDSSRRDLHTTPVNPALPRGEIIATQLANILENNNLYRPHHAQLYESIALIAGVLFLSIFFVFVSPIYSFILLLAILAWHSNFVLTAWEEKNEVWSLTPIIITFSFLFIFNSVTGFFFELKSSRRLQSTFGQYVPTELAKRLAASGNAINMEGEERDLSILFSDVRNFTSISENLSPKDLTVFMNRMLTALSEVIHSHHGTVDKYIGDAVMAFWNAPLEDNNHAKNSVLAAFDMQKQIKKLSDALVKEGFFDNVNDEQKRFSEINLGIGIATGKASVGNMGSALRMAYTAMGDTVNLSSRLEGMTKIYHCPILVTQETFEQCGEEITFRMVDVIRVKGRSQSLSIYEPWGRTVLLSPEELKQISHFETIRSLYQIRSFHNAKIKIEEYLTKYPTDKVAHVYKEKIDNFDKNPPSIEDWDDGITNYKEK